MHSKQKVTFNAMDTQLANYSTISLDEMKSVKLMNRTDTKYVTSTDKLNILLQRASHDYRVQAIDGCVDLPYYTLYFDTAAHSMYMAHLHGKKCRQKIRIRRYESSNLSFLEVKRKNNKGRTDKCRIGCNSFGEQGCEGFIESNSAYHYSDLRPALENRFDRITLVNNELTERVTIDTHLRFHNSRTEQCCEMPGLVVIELKRGGRGDSVLLHILRELRIFPASFSKYCIGMAVTDTALKENNFKPQIRRLERNKNILILQTHNF